MNLAKKQWWASILGWVVGAATIIQTLLTAAPPPASTATLAVITAAFTLLVVSSTALKQWLSPDVSNTASQISLWAALAVIVAALADFINLIHLNEAVAVWVEWALSAAAFTFNQLGKHILPSQLQIQRKEELKRLQ